MANNVKNSNHMQTEKWTNDTGAAVAAGDVVVIGATSFVFLAVALVDMAIGAEGEIGYNCEVTVAKVSAAVFKQGETLSWDASVSEFDDNAATPATGDVKGVAAVATADGANAETTCTVRLTGIPAAIT